MSLRSVKPLIVILGPTASGKSAVGLELARRIDGEIICADSRTVYRHMNIGTAKPSTEEQAEIRHWCLDLVNPDQAFSVADFKRDAERAIADIRSRGKYPIMVGGSGLYIDSVIFDFQLQPKADPKLRQSLERLTTEQLQQYCKKHNYGLPKNSTNRRHLIRRIETKGIDVKNTQLINDLIIVGIDVEKTTLRRRIAQRIDQMLEQGLIEETKFLYKNYNTHLESMTANIYQLVKRYLDGEIDRTQLLELAATRDAQLAKKQRTWFRRNPHIKWLDRQQILPYILTKLD